MTKPSEWNPRIHPNNYLIVHIIWIYIWWYWHCISLESHILLNRYQFPTDVSNRIKTSKLYTHLTYQELVPNRCVPRRLILCLSMCNSGETSLWNLKLPHNVQEPDENMKIAEISETFKKELKLQTESPHDIDIDLNFVAIAGSHESTKPTFQARQSRRVSVPSQP